MKKTNTSSDKPKTNKPKTNKPKSTRRVTISLPRLENDMPAKARRLTPATTPATDGQPVPSKRGGWRPGGGRPKGSYGPKRRTLLEIQHRIASAADRLLNAELIEALGALVVMKRDPETGEYTRVTDEKEITQFVQEYRGGPTELAAGDGSVYIIQATPGSSRSRQYLFDRAYGKPTVAVEIAPADQKLRSVRDAIEQRARLRGVTFEEERDLYLSISGGLIEADVQERLLLLGADGADGMDSIGGKAAQTPTITPEMASVISADAVDAVDTAAEMVVDAEIVEG